MNMYMVYENMMRNKLYVNETSNRNEVMNNIINMKLERKKWLL